MLKLYQAMRICNFWKKNKTISIDGLEGLLKCNNSLNSKPYCNNDSCPLLIKSREINMRIEEC
jgi:hypothetical protein